MPRLMPAGLSTAVMKSWSSGKRSVIFSSESELSWYPRYPRSDSFQWAWVQTVRAWVYITEMTIRPWLALVFSSRSRIWCSINAIMMINQRISCDQPGWLVTDNSVGSGYNCCSTLIRLSFNVKRESDDRIKVELYL